MTSSSKMLVYAHDLKDDPALIERLAQATGVDPMAIADMTLWSGDEASDDRWDRFSWLRFQA